MNENRAKFWVIKGDDVEYIPLYHKNGGTWCDPKAEKIYHPGDFFGMKLEALTHMLKENEKQRRNILKMIQEETSENEQNS